MYSTLPVALTPGWGPPGFALAVPPLPLAISRRRPSGVTRTRGGVPAGRDQAERAAPSGLRDVEDRHRIDGGVGDEEQRPVGRERQAVRGGPRGQVGIERGKQGLGHRAGGGIDDRDGVAVGVGDIEHAARGESSSSLGWSSTAMVRATVREVRSITAIAACAHRLT